MWSGKKPSISHLRAYGCKVFSPIDKLQRRGKLGAVRYKGVLVWYAEDSPSYRVWNPLKPKKVVNVGGAEFDESVEKGWWKPQLGREELEEIGVDIFLDREGGMGPADEVGGGGVTPASLGGGQPPGGDGPPPPNSHQ